MLKAKAPHSDRLRTHSWVALETDTRRGWWNPRAGFLARSLPPVRDHKVPSYPSNKRQLKCEMLLPRETEREMVLRLI